MLQSKRDIGCGKGIDVVDTLTDDSHSARWNTDIIGLTFFISIFWFLLDILSHTT